MITDKNGNVTSRRDFMPFGEEIGLNTQQTVGRNNNPQYNASDTIRQKFTGYEKDKETDLDYAQARYYNNQHGRFTAVDPLLASGKSSNPQTFNRYVYVMNQPTTKTDSTGLQIGNYIGRIYYNSESGAFGNKAYAKANPELGLKPYDGKAKEILVSGYRYRISRYGATQLGESQQSNNSIGNISPQAMLQNPNDPFFPMKEIDKLGTLEANILIEGAKNTYKQYAPDYCKTEFSVPFLGSVELTGSKDLNLFLGGGSPLIPVTMGAARGEVAGMLKIARGNFNFKAGLGTSCGWYLTRGPISPTTRNGYISGTDANYSFGPVSYSQSLDPEEEPSAINIGTPTSFGGNVSTSSQIFDFKSVANRYNWRTGTFLPQPPQ